MERPRGLRSPLVISRGGNLLLHLWHWYFLTKLKLLFEFSRVAPGDDETFTLVIRNMTFSLSVEQQVSSHSLPCELSTGCNKVRGKKEKSLTPGLVYTNFNKTKSCCEVTLNLPSSCSSRRAVEQQISDPRCYRTGVRVQTFISALGIRARQTQHPLAEPLHTKIPVN